jgi:hypothetical protein
VAFGVVLILLGAGGLVVDGRDDLPAQGYGWVPGAAVACVVIGSLLLLGRLGSNGARGFGVVLAGGAVVGLVTERSAGWVPDGLHTPAVVVLAAAVAVGVLAWVVGMSTVHGAGGLGVALGVLAVASLVGDSATRLDAPWDAALTVLTVAAAAGALSAGLAGFGSAFEADDLLALAYAWLSRAVTAGLGLAVSALVATGSFAEPAWVFALLVAAVLVGVLGAAAAVFMGARTLARHRAEFAAFQRLRAEQAVRERLGLDDRSGEDVSFTPEELAGLWDAEPVAAAARTDPERPPRRAPERSPARAPDAVPRPRRRAWRTGLTVFAFVADTIAIVTALVAAVHYLTG